MRVEIFTWGYWFKNVDIDRIEYEIVLIYAKLWHVFIFMI